MVAGERASTDVPFPFTALLARLADATTVDSRAPPFRAVLIPLGRSLQRTAAAPAFFESPRVVVAADGYPRELRGEAAPFLRDRLYLGYQPRADTIEVISYNETAGRFEFQLVTDYRAGGSPKLKYARRALCMSCHQNGGPIFSRGVWSETNANPEIAAALRQAFDRFEGVAVERGVDIPDAIEAATVRASRLAGYQWLWREGCEAAGRGAPAVRCRENAMIAALQYKLSGRQVYDAVASGFRDAVASAMAALSTTQRGAGLAIPDPGLPNRDPLRGQDPQVGVDAAFDPLTLRPPLETWAWNTPELLSRRLVDGVAEFVTDADARRLDAHLFDAALASGATRRESSFDCEMRTRRQDGARSRVTFSCAAQGMQAPVARLDGWLHIDGARVYEGGIDRISFADRGRETETLRNVSIAGGSISVTRTEIAATLRVARDGMHVRRGDGHAVERIRLAWKTAPDAASGTGGGNVAAAGSADVTVIEDFTPVVEALSVLRVETIDGRSDALAKAPIRRAAVLASLERTLGLPPRRWCCVDDARLAAPIVESAPAPVENAQTMSAGEVAFFRHCALCHRASDAAPPNFMAGTLAQVRANLAHCAPRLYVRMAMWERTPGARSRTPMPPSTALRGAGIDDATWRAGTDLAALRGYIANLLQREEGKLASPDALSNTNYERLRDCLPRPG